MRRVRLRRIVEETSFVSCVLAFLSVLRFYYTERLVTPPESDKRA